MTHAPHDDLKGTYLFDGCPRCDEHSRTLYDLDRGTLAWLAERAEDLRRYHQADLDSDVAPDLLNAVKALSMNEMRAVTKLRLYARITFWSEITEEAAG